jgi:hypothetical protein
MGNYGNLARRMGELLIATWYDLQQDGLGSDFINAVLDVLRVWLKTLT